MKISSIVGDCAATWKFYSLSPSSLDGEFWRATKYENYFASNLGRIKSSKRGKERILKPRFFGEYFIVSVYCQGEKQKQLLIHRIIAETFIPNSDNKPQVNHVDGNKINNRVDNLEWVTQSENQLHAYKIGLQGSGENGYQAILTNEQVKWARDNYEYGSREFGSVALAKKLRVSQETLFEALTGRTYKQAGGRIHVPKLIEKVSTDVREEIKRLYVKGSPEFGARALGRKFGCSCTTVNRIVANF